jgi:hypothetical protein
VFIQDVLRRIFSDSRSFKRRSVFSDWGYDGVKNLWLGIARKAVMIHIHENHVRDDELGISLNGIEVGTTIRVLIASLKCDLITKVRGSALQCNL